MIPHLDSTLVLSPQRIDLVRQAHRSLYIDGKILHRDISENNIIITDPKEADGFTGMLIDGDLAKEMGSGRSGGARHDQTAGTMEFMAIQVLQNVAHTYRHDLESFFFLRASLDLRSSYMDGKKNIGAS